MQEFCTLYNDWLDATTYFWVETLISSTNEQQWTNTVTVEARETAQQPSREGDGVPSDAGLCSHDAEAS